MAFLRNIPLYTFHCPRSIFPYLLVLTSKFQRNHCSWAAVLRFPAKNVWSQELRLLKIKLGKSLLMPGQLSYNFLASLIPLCLLIERIRLIDARARVRVCWVRHSWMGPWEWNTAEGGDPSATACWICRMILRALHVGHCHPFWSWQGGHPVCPAIRNHVIITQCSTRHLPFTAVPQGKHGKPSALFLTKLILSPIHSLLKWKTNN